ncbi:MAG: signal peptidase II [Actinobacteria bacterium]|nr:signal peptidase II [Actinomycetota bacterium]
MRLLPTLELKRFPSRALLMAAAALLAFGVDFVSKEIAVALEPSSLLFNVSDRAPFGLGGTLILVAAATSLLACVVPARIVAIGAGAALGGGLGNLTSRHWWDARGGSPDFIPFGDGSTGNIADIFIGLGVGTMVIGSVAWLGWTIATRPQTST